MDESPENSDQGKKIWKTVVIRSLFLLVALGVLYFLWPKLVDLASSASDLSGIYWY